MEQPGLFTIEVTMNAHVHLLPELQCQAKDTMGCSGVMPYRH
jgi:hypothetical protein